MKTRTKFILIPLMIASFAALTAYLSSCLVEAKPEKSQQYMVRVEDSDAEYGQNFIFDSTFVIQKKLEPGKSVWVQQFFKNNFPGAPQKNDTLLTTRQHEGILSSEKIWEISHILKVKIVKVEKLDGYTVKK